MSVIFNNDQRFSVLIIIVWALKIAEFLLCKHTDHGCFSSETVIFVEIHTMSINYQFWNILKNLFASLNQSGVFMIIAESSKDVNLGLDAIACKPKIATEIKMLNFKPILKDKKIVHSWTLLLLSFKTSIFGTSQSTRLTCHH